MQEIYSLATLVYKCVFEAFLGSSEYTHHGKLSKLEFLFVGNRQVRAISIKAGALSRYP